MSNSVEPRNCYSLHISDYVYLIVNEPSHLWCLLKLTYCINETRLFDFVMLSVLINVNAKVIILAIYRVTVQIVKWRVDDKNSPEMTWIAASQIVS